MAGPAKRQGPDANTVLQPQTGAWTDEHIVPDLERGVAHAAQTAVSMMTQFVPMVIGPLSARRNAPKPTEQCGPMVSVRRDAGGRVDAWALAWLPFAEIALSYPPANGPPAHVSR